MKIEFLNLKVLDFLKYTKLYLYIIIIWEK